MADRLKGKVAVISGGATGMGAAQVTAFVREGAKVVFGDINDAEGGKLAETIKASGGVAEYRHLDVTKEGDWKALMSAVVASFGRLDVMVNNAGIVIPRAPVEDRTVEEWDTMMGVNAKGVFLGTKHAIPLMRKAGGGSIINFSSIAGIGQWQLQECSYAASKAAVRIFSKVVASQYGKEKIRCNSVHPGPVDSAMFRRFQATPEMIAKRMERIPLGRPAQVDEIVNGVLFLASDESSFMTGTEFVLDGGASAQ